MKSKKIIWIILVIMIFVGVIIGLSVSSKSKNNTVSDREKIKVTASNFASYDFLRAIIGNNEDINLTFLLGPGRDSHSYDPTAQDLITIQNSDLFVYVGGEMESWSDKVLDSLDNTNMKIICISDDVETIAEQEVDGAETEEEHDEEGFDEHIWTSPKNAIAMVNLLEKEMEELDPKNVSSYQENAENYIAKIKEVDSQIQNIVDNKKRSRLVFGDKMPMQYFINYYDLEVSAAFSGCSTETEPSSKTIAYLVNKAKEEKIPVIIYIEMNTGKVAQTIAKEVGNDCKPMQIQTLHNITKDDFEAGETWVSLMKRNLDVLKAALQ